MFFEINRIFLGDEIFNSYAVLNSTDSSEHKLLTGISKINIFAGSNNSGKSRLLRNLFALDRIKACHEIKPFNIMDENEIYTLGKEFNKEIDSIIINYDLKKINASTNLFINLKRLKILINYHEKRRFFKDFILSFKGEIETLLPEIFKTQNISKDKTAIITARFEFLNQILIKIRNNSKKYIDILYDVVFKENDPAYKITKIYIPALRGLRILDNDTDEQNDFYNIRTTLDYFLRSEYEQKTWKLSGNVFTGLTLYQTIMEHLLGNLSKRKLIADYQTFLKEYFFDGKEVALIPALKHKVLNIKIGNEKEQPIHDVGDGLQSLIILTFPLFLYQNEHLLLFIEEPELFLHPGMQRILLDVYNEDRFNHVQFFIATHSNHFLDMSIDIDNLSIYTIRKKDKEYENLEEYLPSFIIENNSNRDRKVLELLGVRNASVFLSNCTIWVEGITDRLYLRHYLSIYQNDKHKKNPNEYKIFKEDTHFSFLEYGGNNIEHFSFLNEEAGIQEKYLCGKLFLIADQDEGKEERQKKLQEILGDHYKRLERIEIENIISENVLKKILNKCEKNNHDKIAAIKYEDYADKRLGSYIDTLFSIKKYGAESGTLNSYWKRKFCKKAIEFTKSIDDLSKDAKELCKSLYDFIKLQNEM